MTSLTDAVPQPEVRRYTGTAAAFHWLVAVLVVIQVALAFGFASSEGAQRASLFTWHKTVGATILLIVIARLAYRLTHRPPPFPNDLTWTERALGVWNHRLFYLLLIGLPIGGLVAVSANSKDGMTGLALGLRMPVIPGIEKSLAESAGGIHEALAFVLIALVLVHAAAALKHRFIDKTPSAGRMPPFAAPVKAE